MNELNHKRNSRLDSQYRSKKTRSPTGIQTLILLITILLCLPTLSFAIFRLKKSIPHTSRLNLINDDERRWNPSPKIDSDGFLSEHHWRIRGDWEMELNIRGKYGPKSHNTKSFEKVPMIIRQVPGDGNCLFHSLSVGLSVVEEGRHIDLPGGDPVPSNNKNMRKMGPLLHARSALLRKKAVDVFSASLQGTKKDKLLFLQGEEYRTTSELLELAAKDYNLNGEEYCNLMVKDGYWGGGPEIVALCNVLKRPIHVYELATIYLKPADAKSSNSNFFRNIDTGKPQFRLRRIACFGSPRFDRKEPLYILSVDSRFPDLLPGQEASRGNHFLSMFPADYLRYPLLSSQRKRLSNGGDTTRSLKSRLKRKEMNRAVNRKSKHKSSEGRNVKSGKKKHAFGLGNLSKKRG